MAPLCRARTSLLVAAATAMLRFAAPAYRVVYSARAWSIPVMRIFADPWRDAPAGWPVRANDAANCARRRDAGFKAQSCSDYLNSNAGCVAAASAHSSAPPLSLGGALPNRFAGGAIMRN